jgi:hypothetical protein
VVRDSDILAAVTATINYSSARRNPASGRLADCQGTEANEKIVGLVAFVPRGIKDRDKLTTPLSSLSQETLPW